MEHNLTELQSIQLEILKEFDLLCKKHGIPYFIIGGTAIGCVRHQGFIPWDDDIDVGLFRSDYEKFVEIAHIEWTGKIQILNYRYNGAFYHCLTHAVDTDIAVMDEERIIPVKTHVWIDVNPLDGFPNNKFFRLIHYLHLKMLKTVIVLSQFDTLFDINKKRTRKEQVLIGILKKCSFTKHLNTTNLIARLEHSLKKYPADKSAYIGNFLGRYGMSEIMPAIIFKNVKTMRFESLDVPIMSDYDFYLKQLYGDYMELPPENERINRHAMKIVKYE